MTDTVLDVVHTVAPPDVAEGPFFGGSPAVAEWTVLESPRDTKAWTVSRQDGIETFLSPDNKEYVRAQRDEEPDLIVHFTRLTGMTAMRLVLSEFSYTVKAQNRKARRERRELRARGYDAPEPTQEG